MKGEIIYDRIYAKTRKKAMNKLLKLYPEYDTSCFGVEEYIIRRKINFQPQQSRFYGSIFCCLVFLHIRYENISQTRKEKLIWKNV